MLLHLPFAREGGRLPRAPCSPSLGASSLGHCPASSQARLSALSTSTGVGGICAAFSLLPSWPPWRLAELHSCDWEPLLALDPTFPITDICWEVLK